MYCFQFCSIFAFKLKLRRYSMEYEIGGRVRAFIYRNSWAGSRSRPALVRII